MTERGDRVRAEIVALLPRLRRFALSLTKNIADADDLLQSAVVRALAREIPEGAANVTESWMYTIVRNLWIDETRRRKVRGGREPVETLERTVGDDGRVIAEQRSDLARAKKAFDTLSPELRAAAALVIVNEVSYREAAEILGVPIGTVMSRVARSRKALMGAIGGSTPEPEKVE